jgi:hypothetical protein
MDFESWYGWVFFINPLAKLTNLNSKVFKLKSATRFPGVVAIVWLTRRMLLSPKFPDRCLN